MANNQQAQPEDADRRDSETNYSDYAFHFSLFGLNCAFDPA